MNVLVEGLAAFALGLGAVIVILIWHKYATLRASRTPHIRINWSHEIDDTRLWWESKGRNW